MNVTSIPQRIFSSAVSAAAAVFNAVTALVFARDERRIAELRDLYVELTGPAAAGCISPVTCKAVGCQKLCVQQAAVTEAVTP